MNSIVAEGLVPFPVHRQPPGLPCRGTLYARNRFYSAQRVESTLCAEKFHIYTAQRVIICLLD